MDTPGSQSQVGTTLRPCHDAGLSPIWTQRHGWQLRSLRLPAQARRLATRLLWAAVAALGSTDIALGQSAMPQELVPLQGAWMVSAAERDGRRLEMLQEARFTIGEDSFELRSGELEIRGRIRIRIDTSPKQIDLVLSNGKVWRGIFVATARLLRINYVVGDATAERPKLFATSVDAPGTLLVMRRT
jgi:uncharacterized protein (TIGR03067 family)